MVMSSMPRLDWAQSGVPHSGQNQRVKVAPDSARRAWLLVGPSIVTSLAFSRKAAEWPVPLERWQSSQEQRNIDFTSPASLTLTAPQAQRATTSIVGRAAFSIRGRWHGARASASGTLLIQARMRF